MHLGLLSLEYRRIRTDILQIFKILNNFDKPSNKDLLKCSNHSKTRGHNLKLLKQSANTELRKNCFRNTWNSLPNDIVNVTSINSFKNKLAVTG